MSGSTILQIVLLVQVFAMGVLAAITARHALAHFRPPQPKPLLEQPRPSNEYLSPALKEHLLHDSQVQFQSAVKHSAVKLQQDLETSAAQINNLVNRLATEIVESEMRRYHTELTRLRDQAGTDMGGIRAEMTKYKAELKAKLAQDMQVEKQQLVRLMDTKLADAVGSFLVETLQHNVDLGSQSAYLVAMLEEHKADFVKEVVDENQASG